MNIKQFINAFNNTALTIHMGEVCSLDEKWNRHGVCSPFTRLYFIKSGDGYIETKEGRIDLRGGNVYVVPSEHTFSYGCTSLEKIYFHVTVPDEKRYDLLSKIERVSSLPCSLERIAEIEKCFCSDNYSDMLRLRLMLSETVLSFLEKEQEMPVMAYSELVQNAISYVHLNLSIKLSSAEIARELFVSESKLRNHFKAEMGMPLGKYIDDMVFMRARQMLTKDRTPVSDISAELGFCDRFYFSARFRKRFGIPPTKFRRRNREGLDWRDYGDDD